MHLLNALSLNMIAAFPVSIHVVELTLDEARQWLNRGFQSAVGHADTAAVFASVLGFDVPCVRSTVTLQLNDQSIVGQYSGPRLPEGATTLPEGAKIRWLLVHIGEDAPNGS